MKILILFLFIGLSQCKIERKPFPIGDIKNDTTRVNFLEVSRGYYNVNNKYLINSNYRCKSQGKLSINSCSIIGRLTPGDTIITFEDPQKRFVRRRNGKNKLFYFIYEY